MVERSIVVTLGVAVVDAAVDLRPPASGPGSPIPPDLDGDTVIGGGNGEGGDVGGQLQTGPPPFFDVVMSDALPAVQLVLSLAGLTAELQRWHTDLGATLDYEGATIACGTSRTDILALSPSSIRVASDADNATFTLSPVFQRNNSAPRWEAASIQCSASLTTSDAAFSAAVLVNTSALSTTGIATALLLARSRLVEVAFRHTIWPFFGSFARNNVQVVGAAGNESNGTNSSGGGGRRRQLVQLGKGDSVGGRDASSPSSLRSSSSSVVAAQQQLFFNGDSSNGDGEEDALLPPAALTPPTILKPWRRRMQASDTTDNSGGNADGSTNQPLELLLPGTTNITLFGDTATWLDSGPYFSENTTIFIGAQLCPVLNVAPDGNSITVRGVDIAVGLLTTINISC